MSNSRNLDGNAKKRKDNTEEYGPTKKMKLENNICLVSTSIASGQAEKTEKIEGEIERQLVEEKSYNNYPDSNQEQGVFKDFLFSSYVRSTLLNLLWKVQIPNTKILTDYKLSRIFIIRDNIAIIIMISHNPLKKHKTGNNFFLLTILPTNLFYYSEFSLLLLLLLLLLIVIFSLSFYYIIFCKFSIECEIL